MNNKISWYREVLELEPDSRLFLPLARLLVEEGLMEEAESVLDKGVARHPSYLEARLFRVEVLKARGRIEECTAELDELVPVLSHNKGFWKAWAESEHRLGREGTSLAVRLIDLVLKGVVVDMQDIIRRGIESLEMEFAGVRSVKPAAMPLQTRTLRTPVAGTAKAAQASTAPAASSTPAASKISTPSASSTVSTAMNDVDVSNDSDEVDKSHTSSTPSISQPVSQPIGQSISTRSARPLTPSATARFVKPVQASVPAKGPQAEKDKGTSSPRTRSMAEVLAEQEQYRDAAAIYEELIEKCRKGQCDENPAQLARRRDELLALASGKHVDAQDAKDVQVAKTAQDDSARQGAENSAAEASAADDSRTNAADEARASSATGDDGLVGILEELARRMEARIS